MMPLRMPVASHNAVIGANSVTQPKGHVAPHLDCLYLKNAVVQLTMPLASHDFDTKANVHHMAKEVMLHPILIILI